VKLNEALAATGRAKGLPLGHTLYLAAGFEPLHLPTLLAAHYLKRHPGQRLAVESGLYGDLLGNVERAARSEARVCAVALEWSDLDPRLGLRTTGPWSGAQRADVSSEVAARLERLAESLGKLALRMPVVLARPSLSLTRAGYTHSWQLSGFELELEQRLLRCLAGLAELPHVRLVHPDRLAREGPLSLRHDPRAELATGFPFRIEHASVLAEALVELAFPAPPKKGLITDLDDTFWLGLVGEVGVESIAWSQADHAQIHGLYQLALRQLHDAGVLLAVASKNDSAVVERALSRADLWLGKDALFPVAASWGPKSAAVSAILAAWNVSADSVVVVDDSRMELEEIRSVHPGITPLEFSPKDPGQVLELLLQLRDLFGKPIISEEDRLRSASIRSRAVFERQRAATDPSLFVEGLAGQVTFDGRKDPSNARLLSLINKTNQFNLNGLRLTDGEWLRLLEREESFAAGVSYTDRYGALGTIGVVAGSRTAQGIVIEHWVLSCRAFSRRIEDHMLRYLFERSAEGELCLAYRKTGKNMPFQEFLQRLGVDADADGAIPLPRDLVHRALGRLPHRTQDSDTMGSV
jgi:FkbH-like protein